MDLLGTRPTSMVDPEEVIDSKQLRLETHEIDATIRGAALADIAGAMVRLLNDDDR